MPTIAFLLKNWRLIGEAALVLLALWGLWYVDHRGYDRCRAEDLAKQSAALIAGQNAGISALDAEMLASNIRIQQKQSILQTIGKSDDKAPAAPIINTVINSLYNAAQ